MQHPHLSCSLGSSWQSMLPSPVTSMTPGVPISAHLRCSSGAATLSGQADHGVKLQAVLDQAAASTAPRQAGQMREQRVA